MAELEVLQANLNRFHELGASLVALCPQRQEFNDAIKTELGLDFQVLQDYNNQLATAFGTRLQTPQEVIEAERFLGLDLPVHNGTDNWNLPIPARYAIDTDARIQYAKLHVDHRQRTEPQECLEALSTIME